MSRVATRPTATTTAAPPSSRRAPYPASASSAANTAFQRNGGPSNTTNGYASRRAPLHQSVEYRVEKVLKDGVEKEVITIEDTPEPQLAGGGGGSSSSSGGGAVAGSSRHYNPLPGGSGSSTSASRAHHQGTSASGYASSSRYDSYGAESSHAGPAYKKRKSDGAHISDQPYADQHSHQAASYSNGKDPYSGYSKAAGSSKQNGTTASRNNKRKHGSVDTHGQTRDTASSRDSVQRPVQRAKDKKEDLPVKDKDGHFIVRIGDVIDRYAIRRNLGQGTFGKVVCAAHVITGKQVAVKVIRNVPKYREASKVEVKVLNLLKENDAKNQYKCIHLIETFEWVGHVCLVTELLSSSVFDFLKDNGYQPFPLRQIQEFARQLLLSVKYIHSLDLIHTDLKPENILLESTDFREEPVPVSQSNKKSKTTKRILENTNIRLIDFGSATFSGEYHATIVSTRHYRAPEIILGTGWSFECDIWSIGCILIEFFTGEALFQTHENVEHLAMMQRVFGEMPKALMQKGWEKTREAHPDWFLTELKSGKTRPYKLNFPVIKAQNVQNAQPVTSKQSIKFVKQMQPLKDIVRGKESIAQNRFLDLLERLLQWEPERRISIKDALNHPFFQMTIADNL